MTKVEAKSEIGLLHTRIYDDFLDSARAFRLYAHTSFDSSSHSDPCESEYKKKNITEITVMSYMITKTFSNRA